MSKINHSEYLLYGLFQNIIELKKLLKHDNEALRHIIRLWDTYNNLNVFLDKNYGAGLKHEQKVPD